MLDSQFRALYQKALVDPLLGIIGHRLSAPQLTALSCLFGMAVAPLLTLAFNFWALLTLFVSGYLDTLDGSLARYQKKTSSLGAVLDITSDRLVEFSVILGLFLSDPSNRALPSLLMLGGILLCVTSFLVVGIVSQNTSEKSFHYNPGLIERMEAFLFWGAMILFPAYFSLLAYTFTALVVLTTAMHLRALVRQTR